MKKREPYSNPYTGAIRRIDGVIPSDPNHYLWPRSEDQFWAREDLGDRFCRWHFEAVGLADGRWLSDGFVRDEERMRFFPTREAALRHSAAVMLRTIRGAQRWERSIYSSIDRVRPEQYVALVTWAFAKLNLRAPALTVQPEPKPTPWRDLPLFAEAE